jgi:hypothetical protein
MTTEVTSEKTTVGFVEYYNHDRLIGWAVGPDPANAVLLTLFVDGSPKASFAANDLRPDLRHLGSGSGKHGFDVALPRRTIDQSFEVVAADGICLPVFPNAAGLDGWLDRLSSEGFSDGSGVSAIPKKADRGDSSRQRGDRRSFGGRVPG